MLNQLVTDARAWTAATIDPPARWYYLLPDACRSVMHDFGARPPALLPEAERRACAESLAPVRTALESGRGFVILEAPPLPALDATLLYWIVGQGLGRPFAQNVQGTMLYDVRDTGQDLSQGARFSVTSYESSFHTDNSFGDDILDYVGLLCLKTAKSGGISQNVSGFAAIEALRQEHPDVLEILSQPLHVDRRGGFREGESPTVLRPVITWDGSEPVLRYLRYWI